MRMKPKSTVHNPRALLYKRFTDIETSSAKRVVYRTNYAGETKYWVFNTEKYDFETASFLPTEYDRVIDVSENALYRYGAFVFRFMAQRIGDFPFTIVYAWQRIKFSEVSNGEQEVSITFNVGEVHSGTNLHFFLTESIANILTKPVSTISIYQTTGVSLDDFYAIMNFGDKFYTFGGGGTDPTSPYQVPSGVKTDFSVRSYGTNTGLGKPYTMDIGGLISPSGDTSIVVTISFLASGFDLLSALFNDIARYQTNKYYLVGSFDYMIRGTISSSDTQPIKGNIMHLRSFEIKYFDDDIHIDHDDLVVIDGHLYGVEELAYDIKRSPKPYTVYFATLNNIK